MKPRSAAILALITACSTPAPSNIDHTELAAELSAIAEVELHDRAEVAGLTAQGARLSAQQVAQLWQAQTRDYERAREAHAAAVLVGHSASARYYAAIADFRHVEQQYRRAALVVVLAAVSSGLCATTVKTQAFRTRLRADGVDLRGVDVDHIWPKSLGGVDHPLNYQLLDSSLNRSLGAGVVERFMTQPLALVQGLGVSALASLIY